MSIIHRSRAHSLSLDAARAAAEEIAQQLADKYGIRYEWVGSVIHFKGAGAKGKLTVRHAQMEILIELSLMLRPLKGRIEGAVEEYLDQYCV